MLNLTDNGIKKFSGRDFGRNQLLSEFIHLIYYLITQWGRIVGYPCCGDCSLHSSCNWSIQLGCGQVESRPRAAAFSSIGKQTSQQHDTSQIDRFHDPVSQHSDPGRFRMLMSELSERMSQIREYFESWRPAPLNILAGSGLYTGCGLRLTQWRTFPFISSLLV